MFFWQTGFDRKPTTVIRGDGVRLSVPVFGPLDPLPHDLAHSVIERELALQDGFWASVASGALFEGMQVLEGRQPPHARERSRTIMQRHHWGLLFSELLVGVVLGAVKGEPLSDAALPLVSPVVPSRTLADRATLIRRLVPVVRQMCGEWQATLPGKCLRVHWPECVNMPRNATSGQWKAANQPTVLTIVRKRYARRIAGRDNSTR
jgi:hypothetical protein